MMRRPTILGGSAAILAVALLFGGCGKSGPTTMEDLRTDIAAKLPAGWQIGYVKNAGINLIGDAKPDDLVVWKTDKVQLDTRPGATQPAGPANVYFLIAANRYLEPEQFKAEWKKNQAIIEQHERVLHTVNTVPRSPNGELMPRGDAERERVAAFKKAYAELPPYEKNFPTHYYDTLGLRLHDMRTVQLPVERDYQKQQNEVYAAIVGTMKEYKK